MSELAKYHRGREVGAVYGVIRDELIACGAEEGQIEHHMEEIESLDSAMQWAERSLAIDGDNPDTLYNVACCYALMGESDHALDCLEQASLRGTSIAEWAENDSDLASLQDDPRFHTLMESFKVHEPSKK